ncbi:ATP-binding protein [Clostridium sp. MSJ-4]|uniref:ATP-binding protein n=1 Tax=Clostridium simiarum TaxID=2841506 RepID=A0ABS6F062_9CLOT|nr:ATP-binding protein [Clostridium simiarum]MBU5591887.1 ATP-binding protein [Clostridium simiarum]
MEETLKRKGKIIFIAALSALFSQVYMGIFIENFNVSFGIVALIIFFYEGDMEDKLKTSVLCGIFVCVLRAFTYFLNCGGELYYLNKGLINYFPETIFYISYILFYTLFNKRIKNINRLFFYTILCDFFANIVEMAVRSYLLKEVIGINVYIGLSIVAVIRSFFIWIILNLMDRYSVKLLKKEHRARYMNLLMATSRMKSEIYLMEKTMDNVEVVMSKSYKLYNEIKSFNKYPHWEEAAGGIAKDIHEVKKEIALIARGVIEITDDRVKHSIMEYYDVVDLINEMMTPVLKDKNIKLHIDKGQNFKTIHHYYLISVFRNIINNAIDAIEKDDGNIYLSHDLVNKEKDEYHVFSIRDDGQGIDKEDINYIFNPGFSTKINFETGSINRGLGLSIVKEIIEVRLKGTVGIASKKGEGTEFTILIPKGILEE